MTRSPLSRTKRLFVAIVSAAMLAVSFTAVASAVEPTDNSGTVADGETRADPQQCKQYKDWYDGDIKAGDTKSADYYKKLADRRGCKWAERRVTSTKGYGTVTTEPVGINPGPVTTEPVIDSGTVTTTPILVLAP